MTQTRKRMRLEGGGSSFDGMLLEPSASISDLPSEVMKNIFSFVGKGNYCFVAPVSKDFCYNYLTMDVIEDKFAHKLDNLQAIGRNKITTAEAASFSLELAEHCFFKASEDFQKQVIKNAILKGRKDIVEMGHALGIKLEETMNLGSKKDNFFKIAKRGDLEMLQFLEAKGVDIESDTSHIISAAAENGQLQILMWLHENNLCESSVDQNKIFTTTVKSDLRTDIKLSVLKWAKDDACFNYPRSVINKAAKSGDIELVKYLRSKDMPWDDLTFGCAARSGNIALLQYLLENDCQLDDTDICTDAIENNTHEKALEVLQWLHNQGYPWDENTCVSSTRRGNLKALKYLRANGCPWNRQCLINAIKNYHYEMVKFCLENGCPIGIRDICYIAMHDKDHDRALRMLRLLREFSVPWSIETYSTAARAANFEALKWIISNGCPWDKHDCAYHAAEHGNIEALKWMRSHGAVFDEIIFATAASNGLSRH